LGFQFPRGLSLDESSMLLLNCSFYLNTIKRLVGLVPLNACANSFDCLSQAFARLVISDLTLFEVLLAHGLPFVFCLLTWANAPPAGGWRLQNKI